MKIQAYTFGHIKIDGRSYTKDVVLLPPRILSPWWWQQGHLLQIADLDEVLTYAPVSLIIGTGAHGLMKVPDETRALVEAAGIAVEAMVTEHACHRITELISSGKKAAGAFHLTC